jgi:hypothetical protein
MKLSLISILAAVTSVIAQTTGNVKPGRHVSGFNFFYDITYQKPYFVRRCGGEPNPESILLMEKAFVKNFILKPNVGTGGGFPDLTVKVSILI